MLICLNDLFACLGLTQTRKLLTNFSKNSFYLLPEPLRLGYFLTNYYIIENGVWSSIIHMPFFIKIGMIFFPLFLWDNFHFTPNVPFSVLDSVLIVSHLYFALLALLSAGFYYAKVQLRVYNMYRFANWHHIFSEIFRKS